MMSALEVLDQSGDVVEIDARPKSEILSRDGEGFRGFCRAALQAVPQGIIDDLLERLSRTPGLAPQEIYDIIFKRYCSSACHIKKSSIVAS